MQISFAPTRSEARLQLHKSGDSLRINDELFDFSGIPEGATLPRRAVSCSWLASDVERIDGQIRLTLILPHGPKAPSETLFPERLDRVPDGPVAVPPHDIEEAKT